MIKKINSLGSTDAVYVAANFYARYKTFLSLGIDLNLHKGNYIEQDSIVKDYVKKSKWGTHSKSAIFDNEEIMIGTYNIDNRSNFYNSELAIFCKGNQELVSELKENINSRINSGIIIIERGKAISINGEEENIYGDTSYLSRLFMNAIGIPSILFKDLL